MPRRRKLDNSEQQSVSETRPPKTKSRKRAGTEILQAGQSGEWTEAEALKQNALRSLETGKSLTLDLSDLSHLDASALQILLAIQREQKTAGRQFNIANSSPELTAWFDLAGATDFSRPSQGQEG